ncbi:MAG: RES family NAD+ phosphorylase [Bdellovibrionales bacterium]|nr:RES family NAD+ phosphorylase [Bdellovibrionales bacterium]
MFEPCKSHYEGFVFRCFNSLQQSEHLLDDLGLSTDEQEDLTQFFYSDKHAHKSSLERIAHYSEYAMVLEDIQGKFTPEQWGQGRFSDGHWPTLYCAESKTTAIKEKIHYLQKFYEEDSLDTRQHAELAISKLSIQTHAMVDLTLHQELDQTQLSSKNSESYIYCRSIAKNCIQSGASALRSNSARDAEGFCVPIFSCEIIKKDFYIQSWYKVDYFQDEVRPFQFSPRLISKDK